MAAGSIAAFAGLVLVATDVVGGSGPAPRLARRSTATTSAEPTTTTIPPGSSYVAVAAVPEVQVFDSPGATASGQVFENPWFVNGDADAAVPLVFHVEDRTEGWVQVLLPVRPNGSTGWVREADVTLRLIGFRIVVELGEHRLTVYQNDQVVLTDTVAVGKASTPTPTGRYYIRALLKAPNPNTVYGPYAYGLSGHSEVLETFNGGDAELGIHGNNDTSVLGRNVSAGCIRMDNEKITKLAGMLPLGTPVVIEA